MLLGTTNVENSSLAPTPRLLKDTAPKRHPIEDAQQ